MARDEFVHYENHTYYFDKKGHMQDDDVFQKKDETYYINDFKFTGTGSKRRENEALAEEMMFYHQRYHISIEENPYVTQGSILACTKGTNLTRLDARTAVDIRDVATGLPVLGCDACKADENIYSFYGCRASDLSNTPARPVIAGGYKKCIPMLGMWTQPHQTSIIWNSVSGDHTETLIFDSVILCRFGGMIGVVEIPEEKGNASQYVTLEQLDQFHFFMGFTDAERKAGVAELNRVLEKYEITTDMRISFFMGQVKHESRSGARTLEQFNGNSPEEWFNSEYNFRVGNKGGNDGEHFRGAGYIHLTGRYNYEKFAKDMEDPEIVTQGYRVVGGVYNRPVHEIRPEDLGVIDLGEYVWEASGWYWLHGTEDNLNTMSDQRNGFKISYDINMNDDDTFSLRNDYAKEFYRILTGGELEIADTKESLYENKNNN